MKNGAFIVIPSAHNKYTPHHLLMDNEGQIKVATFEEDTEIDGILYKILSEKEVLKIYNELGIEYFLYMEQLEDWDSAEIVEGYKEDLLESIERIGVNSEW